MAIFYPQKILTTNKTEVTFAYNNYSSMIFANSGTDGVTIDLYVTSQIGTDITDTSINVNFGDGYAVTTASQAIVVDGGTFTNATCDYNNDPTINHDDDNGKIAVGMLVSGTGIPGGATVSSVTSDTAFELSASTTGGSVTNGTLTFTNVATSDTLLDEQIWKSNGTLFGTCTAVGSITGITFGGGLVRAMANNDDLYVGTRHHFLKNVKIPKGTSLKLTPDEFKFDDTNYKLYINSSSATGDIDIITRY
jgi:hypothetical protein